MWLNIFGVFMKTLMCGIARESHQLLRPVVGCFAEMMDNFIGLQKSADKFFDYQPVFTDISSVSGMIFNSNLDISCLKMTAAIIPARVIFASNPVAYPCSGFGAMGYSFIPSAIFTAWIIITSLKSLYPDRHFTLQIKKPLSACLMKTVKFSRLLGAIVNIKIPLSLDKNSIAQNHKLSRC